MTKKQEHESDDHAPKLGRREYEDELGKLQVELCYLQGWVKKTGARVVLVFEGRDAAGKGGLIKAITERVSPRVFRISALPAPSDREKSQLYMQRYIEHFPAAGEIVIFDRSWYNRAGVDYVMGFCTPEQRDRFLELCPLAWKNGWLPHRAASSRIKTWLEVLMKEQQRRCSDARMTESAAPMEARPARWTSRTFSRWYDYSRARDAMLDATDSSHARWNILDTNNKRRARRSTASRTSCR